MARILFIGIFLFFLGCGSKKELGGPHQEVLSDFKLRTKRIMPFKTFKLDSRIAEGSGLVGWNGNLWTHNDNGKPVLFALDTVTGKIVKEYPVAGVKNEDWEDLSQDNDYFYIGAFGNNTNKKKSARIYRINKSQLLKDRTVVDSITFLWPEIISNGKSLKVNFNCEAMAVIEGTIYLFTKEWKNNQCTKLFTLPNKPGIYTAEYKKTFETTILITGANYNSEKRKLALCGHSILGSPRIFLFEKVKGIDVFEKDATKVIVKKLPFHQVEGIATFDGITYYLINEESRFLLIHKKQEINQLRVSD
jgi:hypothetical protein